MKKALRILAALVVLAVIIMTYSYFHIGKSGEGLLYETTEEIPYNRVGVLLGAGKYTKDGRLNLFYLFRVEATVRLYNAGKIDKVLVSGDNGRVEYDEPSDLREDLIDRGVAPDDIYLDYAGFRTLDSMVRAKEVFGLDSFTVISQKFHNERAIYIAKHYDLEVIGYNAQDLRGRHGMRTKSREILARTKAVLDIRFGKEPRYLGERINIE